MAQTPNLVTSSVAEEIMKLIRKAIVTKQLVPGERYSVEQVAELLGLGVSRTPVREALVRLADAGMVRFERNRGVRVLQPSVHDLEELFQLRLMVEVPAAYRAAQHVDEMLIYKLESTFDAMSRAASMAEELDARMKAADDQLSRDGLEERLDQINFDFVTQDTTFHELVIAAGGNQRLVRTVRNWRDVITTMGGWRLVQSRAVLSEHRPILNALKERNARGAALAMQTHLIEAGTLLLKELQEFMPGSGGFDPQWFEGVAVPEPSATGGVSSA